MSKNNLLALSALLFATLGACKEDPITTIDRNTDCADICERFKDCVGSSYDVDACTDDCQDMTSNKETANIDDCAACSGKSESCVDGALDCTSECAGVIAASST